MAFFQRIGKEYGWLIITLILFFGIGALAIYFEFWPFMALPLMLPVAIFSFRRYDYLLWFTIFLIPLSVQLIDVIQGSSINMALPTEPILLVLLVMFIFNQIFFGKFDQRLFKHPISIVIILQLVWIFITSLTSSMPLVSLKFLLARLWFVIPFYFMLMLLFRKKETIYNFIWVYTVPFLLVILNATKKHLAIGLNDDQASNVVVFPFYNDHTAYGAALAFCIPLAAVGFIIVGKHFFKRLAIVGILGILFIGLYLSYSRAAWLSLVIAFGVMVAIQYKIRFRYILTGSAIGILLLVSIWPSLEYQLEKNDQVSSSQEFSDHVQSISNISTDASNVERLNRWESAILMFKDRPIFGFGPGTYMFQYAPYQQSKLKTIISTNSGDGGNAHSEYLGPLSESGVFGVLLYILIFYFAYQVSIRNYYRLKNKQLKFANLGFILGISTYAFHGVLNNFLDSDKLSVLFWGSIAGIVAIDMYHKEDIKSDDADKLKDFNSQHGNVIEN